MFDPTPAVTEDGRIIWLDAHGHRDFSPRVQHLVQRVTTAVLVLVALLVLGVLAGVVSPAAESPLGQQRSSAR